MDEKRRQFLKGISAGGILLPFPAICKASNLMPVAPPAQPFPIIFNLNTQRTPIDYFVDVDAMHNAVWSIQKLYPDYAAHHIVHEAYKDGLCLFDSRMLGTPSQLILQQFESFVPTQEQLKNFNRRLKS